ncbi:MAG: hypothetical protein HHJ12_17690 [Glaciimonas sp.]|nr:hypothetical protein [Glaciimonas sp.]
MRSRIELAIQRYKRIIGNCVKARVLPQQKTEAWVSASTLNMMTNLGMPGCRDWPEGAPAQTVCDVICFPSCEGFSNFLVKKDPVEVCLLSHEVMSPDGSTSVYAITGQHSLCRPSSTRTSNSVPCGSPAARQRYGLTVLHTNYTNIEGPVFPAVMSCPCARST